MSTSAYHDSPSDILDERVDSSHLLFQRLTNWRHAVSNVLEFAEQKLSTQQSVSSSLSKQRKTAHNVPNFSGSSVHGGTASGVETPASAVPPSPSNISAGAPTGIANSFTNLAQQVDILVQESEAASQSIKASVVPPLELLLSDIEKHQKTLKTQGSKYVKDIEKQRESTTKHLESLGKSVSTAGAAGSKLDPKADPYVLHRKVRSVAAEQIWLENQFAESNFNVQHNFSSLEQHIIEVLQNAIAQLDEISQRFAKAESVTSSSIHQSFNQIKPKREWEQFTTSNQHGLVPEVGYQRDPSKVSFANSSHESTRPLMEGVLNRKGTVLKNNKPGYYVLTQSGFLHEFKSPDYVEDPQAELSLFIPESELGGLPQRGSGDFTFKIASKDSNKVIASRHKYSFTATSYEELLAWHSALSRVSGSTSALALDDSDSELVPAAAAVPGEAVPAAPQYAPGATDATDGTLNKTAHQTGTYESPQIAGSNSLGSGAATGAEGSALGAGVLGAGALGAGAGTYASQNNAGIRSAAAAQGNPGGQDKLGEFSTPTQNYYDTSSPSDLSTGSGYGSRDVSGGSIPQQSTYNSSGLSGSSAGAGIGAGTGAGLVGAGAGGAAIGSQGLGSSGQIHAYSPLADSGKGDDLSKSVGGLGIKDKARSGKTEYSDLSSGITESKRGKTEYNKYTSGIIPGSSMPGISGISASDVDSHIVSSSGPNTGPPSLATGTPGFQSKPTESPSSQRSQVPHYQISPSKQHALRSDNTDGLGSGSFGAIPVDTKAESGAHHTHVHAAKIGVLDEQGRYDPSNQHHHAGHRHDPSQGLSGAHAQLSNPNVYGHVSARDVEYNTPSRGDASQIASGTTNPLLGSETTYSAPGAQTPPHENQQHNSQQYSSPNYDSHQTSGLAQSQIAAGTTNPLLGSQTSYNAPTSGSGNSSTVAQGPIGKAGVSDLGSKNKAAEQFIQDTTFRGPSGDITSRDFGSKHGHTTSFDRKNDTKSTLDPLSSQYGSNQYGSSQHDSHQYSSNHQYDGFQDAPESQSKSINSSSSKQTGYSNQHSNAPATHYPSTQGHSGQSDHSGHGHAGQGYTGQGHSSQGSPSQGYGQTVPNRDYSSNSYGTSGSHYGTKTTGAAGVGAAGAGTLGVSSGQNSRSGHTSSASQHNQHTSSSQGTQGSAGSHQIGNYSTKDYSSLGPESSYGAAASSYGPGEDAGQAKSQNGSGYGAKLGGIAGGVGALAGIAGAVGIPGAGEAGQFTSTAGQLGSQGIGGAVKSHIPGYNEANQVKQASHGDASGIAKQHVPYGNEAQQLQGSYKDVKGGNSASKAEGTLSKDAEGKAAKESKGPMAKIANVFKSS